MLTPILKGLGTPEWDNCVVTRCPTLDSPEKAQGSGIAWGAPRAGFETVLASLMGQEDAALPPPPLLCPQSKWPHCYVVYVWGFGIGLYVLQPSAPMR